jgi:AcrR family transcriptional regulator
VAAPTRTQRRRQRTNAAILDAAQAAFAAGGYDTASIEQIAEAADVAVGSVYNHFGSKEGLLWAVAERALGTDEAYMDAAYLPDRSPFERIQAAGVAYARFAVEHPEPFRLLAFPHRPQSGPAAETAQRVAERVDATNRRLVAAIQAGIDAGVLRDVPAEETATFLWAAWNGVLALSWRPDHLRRDPDELAELLRVGIDLVTHGILR